MSNQHTKKASKPVEMFEGLPDVAQNPQVDHKISLESVRQECIKLSYSASKSLLENLRDAAAIANWVMTGQEPESKEQG